MGTSQSVSRVDLSGKVAVVTGANTGLGYEVAKSLASMGAHTVVACRSEKKAKEVRRDVEGGSRGLRACGRALGRA